MKKLLTSDIEIERWSSFSHWQITLTHLPSGRSVSSPRLAFDEGCESDVIKELLLELGIKD